MTRRAIWDPWGIGRGTVLLALALALGFLAIKQAMIQSLGKASPDLILSIDPTSAAAIDSSYRKAFDELATGRGDPAQWTARARAALRHAPLSAAMIRIAAVDPNEASRSTRLLRLAEKVSRRDALTQLSLIEIAVQENRIDQALLQYDRALSIYPDLGPTLFPVLAAAIDSEDIRNVVAALAQQHRPWINNFLDFAVRQAQSTDIARLLMKLDHGPNAVPVARQYEAALVGRLAAQGKYAIARTIAIRAMGNDAEAIDRLSFSQNTWQNMVRPLSWTESEIEGVSALLQPDGSVAVTASPGTAGLAMFRIAVLTPGAYRFSVKAFPAQDMASAGGRWIALCLSNDRSTQELANIAIDGQRPALVNSIVNVPEKCGAVRWDFVIDNSAGSSESGIDLSEFSLNRQS